jgi:hypothetical protein
MQKAELVIVKESFVYRYHLALKGSWKYSLHIISRTYCIYVGFVFVHVFYVTFTIYDNSHHEVT